MGINYCYCNCIYFCSVLDKGFVTKAKFQLYQQYLYICCMKTKEDIKLEFAKLSAIDQEQLLDELLRDYETRGQILETLTHEIQKRNKKKPCPHCASEIVYKRGKQKGVLSWSIKTGQIN